MAVGCRRRRILDRVEFDAEAEAAHFLDEHVEALGNAGLERVVALDDRFIDLGPADHVVRLHRQHFLQRVGGAVGLQRPHLHLAEALAAELRLAAQRLLGDQAVRPDRARVDLVVDQMVQLQHVDVAHGHLAVERIAGAAVEQGHLARLVEPGLLQHRRDVRLRGRRRTPECPSERRRPGSTPAPSPPSSPRASISLA